MMTKLEKITNTCKYFEKLKREEKRLGKIPGVNEYLDKNSDIDEYIEKSASIKEDLEKISGVNEYLDKITSVGEYLEKIKIIQNELNKNNDFKIFGYRGEQKEYPQQGTPNLFRDDTHKDYLEYEYYEQNILDEVISNKLAFHKSYLETAIEAQHGGFPSRLLDFSFNALIALFFAVTPHYKDSVDKNDQDDGIVIIYGIDKMKNSSSKTFQQEYENIIENNYICPYKDYEHVFVDYVELNARIKAQQGGFILFKGDHFIPVPAWRHRKLIISADSKKSIRDELKNLFRLTNAYVYPEMENQVLRLTDKSKLLYNKNDDSFQIFKNDLDSECNFYINEIRNKIRKNVKVEELLKTLTYVERKMLRLLKDIECENTICLKLLGIRKNEKQSKIEYEEGEINSEEYKKIKSELNEIIAILNKFSKVVNGDLTRYIGRSNVKDKISFFDEDFGEWRKNLNA